MCVFDDRTVPDGYVFEVGVAKIPQVNPDNGKVISQGPSVCIFKKDDSQEVIASWLFVKFLTTSVDFQAEFSIASGYVPVLKSVSQTPAYKAAVEKANGETVRSFGQIDGVGERTSVAVGYCQGGG